ncbi:two-component sensor histidine kinase, partial [Streptomyces sp. Ru73]|uniref:sensor histidine kinase n=1 Tax=Streptomyces sp. Ru73 TaxID=2080748 RepID=UPI000D49FA60
TLEELRHMVGILRAAGGTPRGTPDGAAPAELAPQPDLAELPRLIEMSALDVTYENGVDGDVPTDRTVERAAFRTVQEALTNVRKHAPGARVRVRVAPRQEREAGLLVEVRNGPPDAGADTPQLPGGGHGLVGLRERAQSLGGTLEARPTPDGGFVVRAEFPRRAA